ncbi:MAG: DUF58 domain-containing protein [Chromatiales bacterium]|nr:DUF58 domain-containing protein [Chromatiales bacterium]
MSARASTRREPLQLESSTSVGIGLPEPVVGLSLVLLVVGVLSSSPRLTGVSVILVVVVLLARAWANLALSRLTVTRTLSKQSMFVGEDVYVELTLENRKPLPLPWLRFSFNLPEGLALGDRAAFEPHRTRLDGGKRFYEMFSLASFERVRAVRHITAKHRGCYRLGAAHLESGDLFGFYVTRGNTLTHHDELVVFPTPRHLPGFEIPPRQPEGAVRGPIRLHADESRPRGAREYQPGDPMRHMDWKAMARYGKPMVRVFDHSNGHQVVILLDALTSSWAWRYHPEQLEAAVDAAASVATLAIEAGHQVGLVTNGTPLATGRPILRPAAGLRQLELIMHSLARVQPMLSQPLGDLFDTHAAALLPNADACTLIYITGKEDEDANGLLARLCAKGAVGCCIYVGAGAPPDTGTVPLYDYSEVLGFASRQEVEQAKVLHA